jgi:hypothetical protein
MSKIKKDMPDMGALKKIAKRVESQPLDSIRPVAARQSTVAVTDPCQEIKTIEPITIHKTPVKRAWTRISIRAPENVAQAINYLMQHPETHIDSQQTLFQRFAFDGLLAAAKEHGYQENEN